MDNKKATPIIIFSLLVYLAMIIFSDSEKLIEAVKDFTLSYIFLIFALTTTNYAFRYLKWDYFLNKSGTNLPAKENIYIFASGLSMIITPGKMGEIWKSWLIKDHDNTPLSKTIPVVIIERLTDVTGLALLALTGALIYSRGTEVILFFAFAMISFFAIIKSRKASGKMIELLSKKMENRAENIKEMHKTLDTLTAPKGIILMTILSAFAWFFECLALWLTIRGFGETLGILESTFIFSLASLAGAISMLPGGLGVAEGTITGSLLYFGIPEAESVGISIIVRAGTLWYGALMGMIIHVAFKRYFTKTKAKHIKKTEP